MGSGASTVIDGVKKEWMDVFSAMQFSRAEIVQFYEIYNTIDTDKSGEIDVAELLKFLGIESSIFTERIFEAFDKDGTGKIDFFEFVVSLWKFCALGKESINVFAFDLYDTDADGALTEIEVKVLFHDLYWYGVEPKENEKSRRTLSDLLKTGDGFITIEEFRPFCQTHAALLKPVFDVQDKLREAAMGVAFWDSMSTRKIELSKGHSVALADLMVKAQDREDFNRILHDKSSGGVVRQMMHSLHLSRDAGDQSGGGLESPSRQSEGGGGGGQRDSFAKLFNPFRRPSSHTATASHAGSQSRSYDEADGETGGTPGRRRAHSSHSNHSGRSHNSNSHSQDLRSLSNDKGSRDENDAARGQGQGHGHGKGGAGAGNGRHKDSLSSVPTIELGLGSGEHDELLTLGQ